MSDEEQKPLVGRLWIKSRIAGYDASRPWKTLDFSPVDFLEKGHGWLFPRPMPLGCVLVRLH